MFSTCFGGRNTRRDPEREPLLPQYGQDTDLQCQAQQKLHSYQIVRALTRGYMPSTEQTTSNLRTLLASDLLNPEDASLSDSGHRLTRLTRQWIEQFIALLRHKNNDDQLQDIIWFLANSNISVDSNDLQARMRQSKSKADTDAAYQSLRTLSSLLLTNPNFRVFLHDLNTVGREIFSDSASALSETARQAAGQVEPTANDKQKAKEVDDSRADAPSGEALEDELKHVGRTVVESGTEVAQTTVESAEDKLSGNEGKALLSRLKRAITSLRKREDYENSVSTLSVLVKRYATIYSRAAEEVVGVAQDDINENEETDRALKKLWDFVQTFGDKGEWRKCEELLNKLISDQKHDPEFENFIQEVGDSLQNLLTDPDFFEDAISKFQELREKSKRFGKESSLRHDVDLLLSQLSTTLASVAHDRHIQALTTTTRRIAGLLFPTTKRPNSALIHDLFHTFFPLVISAIQKLPIPRLELSTPAIDLLLENLVLEPPRRTVNRSSFLPHRFRLESHNDVEIRAVRPEARDHAPSVRSRPPATSSTTHRVTLRLDGLCAQATDVGFWLRARGGPLSLLFPLGLSDEGLASIRIDKRGLDIRLELDVSPSFLLQPFSSSSQPHAFALRHVRVRVHNLEYQLRRSKVSWLVGWLARPFLRAILRKTIERKLAQSIAYALRGLERELVMARERVRGADAAAAGKSDPWGWLKAVFLGRRGGGQGGGSVGGGDHHHHHHHQQQQDAADSWTRVGVDEPGQGVFRGVYAPGSVVKVWKEEGERARERIEGEWDREGWRNAVFDLPQATRPVLPGHQENGGAGAGSGGNGVANGRGIVMGA